MCILISFVAIVCFSAPSEIVVPSDNVCFIISSSEYLLVGQSRELRNKWMIKLQEQNPNLVEHASHNTPDMAKYRKGSLDPTHLHGIHVEQENHEEPVIEESEELSDHERHEPDEEEDETSGFLGDHNHSSEVQ